MDRFTLIFGGTGFIGEYVVRELKKRGEKYEVIDAKTTEGRIREHLVDATHVVWLVPPAGGPLARYADTLSRAPHVARFLFASTMLLYADSGAPQDEAAPIAPMTDYEEKKYAEEELLREAFAGAPEKLVIARLSNVYGDTKNTGIIARLFRAAMGSDAVVLNGNAEKMRDYVHVEDVARLLVELVYVEGLGKAEVFNICTGRAHSIRELVAKIEALTNRSVPLTFGPPIIEKEQNVGSNEKILRLLNEKITLGLDAGLEKTYARYL